MSSLEKRRSSRRRKTASRALAALSALGLALLVVAPGVCTRSGGGLSVTLEVRERAGVTRRAEPVTSGVPVAKSLDLRTADGLRLLDSSGREVPAQFAVTSRWGGSPSDASRPIRWLLIDFQADVGAGGTAAYRLEGGGDGSVRGTTLRVTRSDAQVLEISTGPAHFAFGKRAFRLFDSVHVGGQRLLSAASSSGIIATDTSGRVYSSAVSAPSEVALEVNGPLRKTVRVKGALAGPGGKLLHYTARISLFAGHTRARVALSVINKRDPVEEGGQPQVWHIGSPRSASFRDLSLRLECNGITGARFVLGGVAGGSHGPAGSAKVYQDSSGTAHWDRHRGNHPRPQSYVSFRGYKVYRDGSQVASGTQASPWLDLSGAQGGVEVAARDFWQNFPKALRGSGGAVEAGLFPTEYAGNYSFRPQEQKTHELLFNFHGGSPAMEELSGLAASLQEPLFAQATPTYYLSSGALGRVTGLTGDPEFDAYERLNTSTLGGGETDLYKVRDEADFYGWQDYGDVPIDYEDGGTGTFNQKYNFDYGMMLQFMRTGDFRWFTLADSGGRHVADLDVLHFQGEPDVWWEGGFFGHSYHDEDSNSNPNRNEGAPHPDLVFGAPGLFLLHYMTGNRVAYDTAMEISKNIRYRFDNSFGRGNDQGYANAYDYDNECESPRPFAHGLMVLVEAFRATGDESYLATSGWLIRNAHSATDMFITDPVPGDRRYTKIFTWDLLELSLGRYLDLCAESDRRDPAGARELLLSLARQEAEVMWRTDERGNKGVPYAWMRDGTPWGWEDYEVAVNVCNWHLLTADALAYAYAYGGGAGLMDRAREAFKTGSDPVLEYYEPTYTATKEATNSANFGLVYMHQRHPPGDAPSASEQFQEWLCLENPGAAAASVTIEYFMDGGAGRSQVVEVPARSRRTVSVNEAVGGGRDVSARVTGSAPVVVERPMYFNYHGAWQGGHCTPGALEPARKWYFAEGCTRPGFEEWLTVQNPGGSDAHLTLTYMLEGEGTSRQEVTAPAASRTTISVNGFLGVGHNVSTLVVSDQPVVVERPMYFLYRDKWSGGHTVVGAREPSREWHFAEGTTRSNPFDGSYEEWICLQNPNDRPATAHVTYLLDSGAEVPRDYRVEASSRLTVDVNMAVGPDRDVSAKIDSDLPLVAERPLYFNYRNSLDGGHAVVGSAGAGTRWHFAEGCTRDGFQTWLCVSNPQAESVEATVDYYLASGRTAARRVVLPPRSRTTIDVNRDVGPMEDVSMHLVSDAPVMVERPVYFNYGPGWAGGDVAAGSARPEETWYFAEGCTR
jgi:hypothetical protein